MATPYIVTMSVTNKIMQLFVLGISDNALILSSVKNGARQTSDYTRPSCCVISPSSSK